MPLHPLDVFRRWSGRGGDIGRPRAVGATERRVRSPVSVRPLIYTKILPVLVFRSDNGQYVKFRTFCSAVLDFLKKEVPAKWRVFCDDVTDNFRVICPKDFRILR